MYVFGENIELQYFTKLITEKYDLKILQQLLNTPHLPKDEQRRFHLSGENPYGKLKYFKFFDQRISITPANISKCPLHRFKRNKSPYIILHQPFYCIFCSQENNDAQCKTHLCGKCRKSYC